MAIAEARNETLDQNYSISGIKSDSRDPTRS
uniref:Uncharacterized protein n=1 Tax=Romanomermis culicivorax TaxID=13658 RepID=A0A915KCP5_ROMCU